MASDIEPLQLLDQFFSSPSDTRALLRQALADAMPVGAVDPKAIIEGLEDTSLNPKHKLVVDCQRHIVRKSFVGD